MDPTAMTLDQTPTTRESRIGQTEVLGVVVLSLILGQRWLIPLLDGEALGAWSTIFLAIVVQSVPFLIGGVLLSAIISTLISERALRKIVPGDARLAVPVAGLAGIGLPGCECAAVPVASSLIRRGVVPAVALTFLLAAPAVNPAVLISTAVAFPNQPMMVVARFVASLATAVLVGWWCLSRGTRLPMLPQQYAENHDSTTAAFLGAARHDFLHASGFLVLGAMFAAGINAFAPRALVESVAGNALLGVLTLALFAFVTALCSEADAFVAASFTAFSSTAQLVFMVVGPAQDIKLAAMEAGQFGRPFAVRFVPVVLVTAIVCAVLAGRFLL